MQPVGGGGVDSGSAVVNNDRARAGRRRDESLLHVAPDGGGGKGGGGESFSAGIVSGGQGPGARGQGRKDRGGAPATPVRVRAERREEREVEGRLSERIARFRPSATLKIYKYNMSLSPCLYLVSSL
jgi:hypothetical protein